MKIKIFKPEMRSRRKSAEVERKAEAGLRFLRN